MRNSLCLLSVATLLPVLAAAAPPNMAPGLWEITTRTEMPGMPMEMPAQTIRHCFRAEDLKDAKDGVPVDKSCRFDELAQSGNTVRWKVTCSMDGAPMTGTGQVTHAGQSYSGTMNLKGRMDGQEINMTSRYSGRRVGDCK